MERGVTINDWWSMLNTIPNRWILQIFLILAAKNGEDFFYACVLTKWYFGRNIAILFVR